MPYNQEVITFIQRDDGVISVYGGTTMFSILVYYVTYKVPGLPSLPRSRFLDVTQRSPKHPKNGCEGDYGLPGSTERVHSSEDRR